MNVEPIPHFDDAEWDRQFQQVWIQTRGTAPEPKGKLLWLAVRRALCMVISAFDQAYGIEPKKRL